MERIYTKWIEFELAHDYYRTAAEAFRFHPLPSTARTLGRIGALFRETETGFVILYPERRLPDDSTEPVHLFPTDLRLQIGISVRDPYVGAASELTLFRPHQTLVHLDNIDTAWPHDIADADLVPVRPPVWTYSAAATGATSFLLASADGRVIDGARVGPVDGRLRYRVDLSDHPPGRYHLSADGGRVADFYSLPSAGRPDFAVVDLSAGADVPTDAAFLEADGAPKHQLYTARLAARTATWRYYVVPRYTTTLNAGNLNIDDSENRYTFGNASETITQTGETAFLVESTGPIPMQREPIRGVSLKRGGGMVLVSDLRTPDLPEIKIRNDQVYAEMHVYV